jgi:hypothetical protein
MGGQSSSTQTQQSQTAPWTAAQPMLQSILGQLSPQIANSGINSAQTGALNSIEANAANGNPYAPQIAGNASSLLSGGGALNQTGNINNAYKQYYNATNPLASNTNYDPMQTPGIGNQLQAMQDQITGQVNGSFAAAGRDGSGYNQKTLGQGLTAGLAPILTNQYNQNIQNQQGAASNLYQAGNTTAGLQAGLQQQAVANGQQGTQAASDALTAGNYGANQTLAAEAQRTGIPIQQLGMMAQIGIPIAGLGSQSNGTSTGTSQMSGAQQFATILQGIGSLIPKAPTTFNF